MELESDILTQVLQVTNITIPHLGTYQHEVLGSSVGQVHLFDLSIGEPLLICTLLLKTVNRPALNKSLCCLI